MYHVSVAYVYTYVMDTSAVSEEYQVSWQQIFTAYIRAVVSLVGSHTVYTYPVLFANVLYKTRAVKA